MREVLTDHLQIFNIEMKVKMKFASDAGAVVFWKRITPKMLGLVTQSSAYHWSIEGDTQPVKIFERTENLVNNQIINYRCDPSEKYLILIGIAPGSPERPQLVKGSMQLFSAEKQQSQALEAHAAAFAQFKIEKHELLEMRCIAAYIYMKAGRGQQSIALSKKDNRYRDAMETASQSGDRELAEELLVYFIEQGKKECFASCLFVCYDLLRTDVVLELAWLNSLIDFAFPYLLQFICEYTGKIDELVKDKIEALVEVKAKEREEDILSQQNMYAQLLPLALPAPPVSGMAGGFAPPPSLVMGSMGMPPLPAFGMPPMDSY